MKVTVVIPTYNGAHKIFNLLRALERQSFQDFDTLVVIDGSTDATVELIRNKQWNLRTVQIEEQENKGRAAVRNTGAQVAGGDLLIFFDDDMRPAADCVAAHVQHHLHYKNSICVGPQINDGSRAKTDIIKFKSYNSQRWEKKYAAVEEEPLSEEHLYLTAANFSISKALFLNLGGFDERLNDAEDYDLAIRAHLQGVPLYFNTNAFAWHDEHYTMAEYINRRKQYVVAYRSLMEMKPELMPFLNRRYPKNKKKKNLPFFWLFSSPVWVSLIDQYAVFSWLPVKIKYRLYDWVITSHVIYFYK